jgi:hypothetical protein
MKPKPILWLALVLSGVLTGCVMDRQFYGTGTNLTGDREQIPLGSHLKMSVASSGDTTNGGRYMVLSLPKQDCWFVLFYPNIKPDPYQFLRVEIGAKQTHVWQYEGEGTNHRMEELSDGPMQTGTWFVKGKKFDFSRLSLGTSQFGLSVTNSERLHGQLEIGFENHSEFNVNVDLSSDDGTTTFQGEFWSEKSLWPPLVGPAMLIFGDDGPGWLNSQKPIQSQKALSPENKKPLVNIKIAVRGDVKNSGDYSVPEGTTVLGAIRIADGRTNQDDIHPRMMVDVNEETEMQRIDSSQMRVKRTESGEQEVWTLDMASPLGGSFSLIEGDEVEMWLNSIKLNKP